MKAIELLRRAAGKPPGYAARRALREARKFARTRWVRRRLQHLAPRKLAREGGYSSLAEFWSEFAESGFLYTKSDRERLRDLYRTEYFSAHAALRSRVDKALRHEFDLLGSGPTELGEIDWHLDFKSGRRWDLAPSNKIEYAELDKPTDVKVPWELSRGHQWVSLGQAWVVDRDERAVPEFESQIRSWVQANPAGLGVNWACTMEVALRAVNWVWALALFADAPLGADFLDIALTGLYRHGLWMPENLEVAHINGNHYIADALGLVACGALFRRFPEGRAWLDQGSQILEQEIGLQIDDEGVDIEASVPYHRLVLEIFATGARLLEAAGRSCSSEYSAKLQRMTDFVHAYTLPDGQSPVIGDNDDGRVLVFGGEPLRDHRYLLSTGCALFGRSEWKCRSSRFWEESLWFLGPSSRERYHAMEGRPESGGRDFKNSGFQIFRSAWQYLFIDAGPVGFKGLGGHGHNDCLSFEWHVHGRPVLTDSGLFVYTASPQWRDIFRSTEFHNTIRVDGEEINHFLSPPTLWFLGNDAQPIDVNHRQEGSIEILHAGHSGYRRLPDPVTVSRTFALDHDSGVLRLVDRLEGSSDHLVEFFFHAAPGAEFRKAREDTVEMAWPDDFALRIERESGPSVLFTEKQGWFAPSYGVKFSRPVCVASVRTSLPFELRWKLTVRK